MDARLRDDPAAFRAALTSVAPAERDAWVDRQLGIEIVEDDPSLPRGCVPYLPAPVDALIHIAEYANVTPSDVFVDIGSGVGRAATVMHLLTGATAIGLEIQPPLVTAARDLATRIGTPRVSVIEGDAVSTATLTSGTVFFLYCPFSGERLTRLLAELEVTARARPLRICCLDLPLPEAPWLILRTQSGALDIYSTEKQ